MAEPWPLRSADNSPCEPLTLTVLVRRIRVDRRLMLAVKSHLTRVSGRVGCNISCPVGHGLEVVKRLVDSG